MTYIEKLEIIQDNMAMGSEATADFDILLLDSIGMLNEDDLSEDEKETIDQMFERCSR